jgi:hypothetical protein
MQPEGQKFSKLLSASEVSTLLGVSAGTLAVWRSTKRYPLKFIRAQKPQQDQGRQQQVRAREQEQNRQQSQQQVQQPSQPRQRVEQAQRREVWQQHRATNWQSEHRDWQQRGGYNGYRIPDDRYRGHFGQDHWFRIHSYPMELYGGYPRFQYGGFWFGFMDPWPEYWPDDWYNMSRPEPELECSIWREAGY